MANSVLPNIVKCRFICAFWHLVQDEYKEALALSSTCAVRVTVCRRRKGESTRRKNFSCRMAGGLLVIDLNICIMNGTSESKDSIVGFNRQKK